MRRPPSPGSRRPVPAGPTLCAGRTSQCSVSFSSWKPACRSRLRHSATTVGGRAVRAARLEGQESRGGLGVLTVVRGGTAVHELHQLLRRRLRRRLRALRRHLRAAPSPLSAGKPGPGRDPRGTGDPRPGPARARPSPVPAWPPPPRAAARRPLLPRRNAQWAPRAPSCGLHPELCTPSSAPRNLHPELCTPQSAPRNLHPALQSAIPTPQSTSRNLHPELCTPQSTPLNPHPAICTQPYSPQSTPRTLHPAIHTLQAAVCTLHPTICDPTMHTLHPPITHIALSPCAPRRAIHTMHPSPRSLVQTSQTQRLARLGQSRIKGGWNRDTARRGSVGSKGQGQAPQGWSPILSWCAPVLGLTRRAGTAPR